MSDEVENLSNPPTLPAPTSEPRARSRWPVWPGLLLVLLLAAAWLVWQAWNGARSEQRAAQDEHTQLGARVETIARTAEQARRDAESVRSRLDDAAKVNESLRAQLLGLGERARLVEDAVASLADKRLSGHDAMLLDEAEMLLALAGERLGLFHDSAAAIDAYRLADTALATIDDAVFSTVRQSISAETEALAALQQSDAAAALGRLETLRGTVPQLPGPTHELPEAAAGESRWTRLLGQFIRIHHGDDVAAAVQRHEIGLARQLLILDLRDAQAALLARDQAQFHAALGDAQAVLGADFDAGSQAVAAARTSLDALAKLAVAPAPPANIGTALRELRNLRATHALRQPTAISGAAPSGDPQ